MLMFESIDAACNRARWYGLHLQARLFGGVDVVCRWGRIGHIGGSERREMSASVSEAERRLEALRTRRARRGYALVSAAAREPATEHSDSGWGGATPY